MFDLKIIGDKKLQRQLNNMSNNVTRKIMRPALHKALQPVADLAKQKAPKGKTGRTAKFIKTAVKNSRRHGITGSVRTGTRKQMKIDPNNPFYYPAAHEYGTRFMPAKSFLRASLGSRRTQALKTLGSELHKGLKKTR